MAGIQRIQPKKINFPRNRWLTNTLLVICPGPTQARDMPWKGKRSMVGMPWGPCHDPNLYGNYPAPLAALQRRMQRTLPFGNAPLAASQRGTDQLSCASCWCLWLSKQAAAHRSARGQGMDERAKSARTFFRPQPLLLAKFVGRNRFVAAIASDVVHVNHHPLAFFICLRHGPIHIHLTSALHFLMVKSVHLLKSC